MIYACQDVDFDRQAGLRSIPVRLGVAGALRLAAACHFATIVLLACLPLVYPPLGAIKRSLSRNWLITERAAMNRA